MVIHPKQTSRTAETFEVFLSLLVPSVLSAVVELVDGVAHNGGGKERLKEDTTHTRNSQDARYDMI